MTKETLKQLSEGGGISDPSSILYDLADLPMDFSVFWIIRKGMLVIEAIEDTDKSALAKAKKIFSSEGKLLCLAMAITCIGSPDEPLLDETTAWNDMPLCGY